MKSRIPKNGEKWHGQAAINQEEHDKDPEWEEIYSDRIKVRIYGYNPPSGADLDDNDLVWASIIRPTSQGFANYGSSGIFGGEFVTGYFWDGVPYIDGVLSKNVRGFDIKQPKNGSTEFLIASRFNNGWDAENHQRSIPGNQNSKFDTSLSSGEKTQVKNKGIVPTNSKKSYLENISQAKKSSNPKAICVVNTQAINNGIIPQNAAPCEPYSFVE